MTDERESEAEVNTSGDIVSSKKHVPIAPRRFLAELSLLFALGLLITVLTLFLVYPALGFSARSPQPIRTILLLCLLTWLIRKNGESWGDFGLKAFRPWWLLPILAVGLLAILNFIAQPLGDLLRDALNVTVPKPRFLDHIYGNAFAFAGWLVIGWTTAAFGEEMICRGYLLNRFGQVLGARPLAWAAAVILQASIFGALHGYLGLGAAITIGFKALFTGTFYLLCKRNLWPLILTHGIWDTLGLTLVYLTGVPST